MDNNLQTKAGFVAIIGAPNAGKSTLLNALVGEKVAIVTHKVQTTRHPIRGIVTEGDAQFIFVDTPGIHKPRRGFDKAMVNSAWQTALDSDVVILLIDAMKGFREGELEILDRAKQSKKPLFIALNKVDAINKERLLPIMAQAQTLLGDKLLDVFAISAEKKKGLDAIFKQVAKHLPVSPFLYDPETHSDQPFARLLSEICREQAFLMLHQEIPYGLHVETLQIKTREDHSLEVHQNLIVERDGHKGIAIGAQGATLKRIGSNAREEMTKAANKLVHLFLQVKVDPNWTNNKAMLQELGLEPSKE